MMKKKNRNKTNSIEQNRSFYFIRQKEGEGTFQYPRLRQYFVVWLALLFCFFYMRQCFNWEIPGAAGILMSGLILAFYQWGSRQSKEIRVFLIICYAAAVILTILWPAARDGWSGVLHQMSEKLAEKGIIFGNFTKENETLWVIYICVIACFLILSVVLTELERRNAVLLFLLITLFFLFFLFWTGWVPSCAAVMVYFVFLLLLMAPALPGAVILMAIGVLVIVFFSFGMHLPEEGVSKIQTAWEQWRYQADAGILPEGNLENAIRMERGEETALLVQMEENTPYYLRGFIGSTYGENQWENNGENIRSVLSGLSIENKDFFALLREKGYDSRTQMAETMVGTGAENVLDALENSDAVAMEENQLKIKNISANRRYLYLPYELITPSFQFVTDGTAAIGYGENLYAAGLRGGVSYSCKAMPNYVLSLANESQTNKFSTDGSFTDASSSDKSSVNESEADSAAFLYEEYVKRTCLTLSKEIKEVIASVLEEKKMGTDLSYVSVIKIVKHWLKENISYDANPGKITDGEDFAQWFLKEKKAGYDVQYAAAAVLFFRYYGIPSRYVEGYLVTPGIIHDAEGQGETEVAVSQKQAHAWAEIYTEETGWIPVEVMEEYENTMGLSYDEKEEKIVSQSSGGDLNRFLADETTEENKPENGSSEESLAEKNKLENGSSEENIAEGNERDTEEKTTGKDISKAESVEGADSRRNFWFIRIGCGILIAVGVFIAGVMIYAVDCWLAWERREKEWETAKNPEYGVKMWFLRLRRILLVLEKEQPKDNVEGDNRLRTTEKKLMALDDAFQPEELKKAFALRQKAVYGQEPLTEGERKFACGFFKKESKLLEKRLSFWQKLNLRMKEKTRR